MSGCGNERTEASVRPVCIIIGKKTYAFCLFWMIIWAFEIKIEISFLPFRVSDGHLHISLLKTTKLLIPSALIIRQNTADSIK